MLYEEILEMCKGWICSIQKRYIHEIMVEIGVNNSETLIANIDSKKYVSQLYVSKDECCSNHFVEFIVLDIQQDTSKIPAFWYEDKEGDTGQSIIENLNKGLNVLLEKY